MSSRVPTSRHYRGGLTELTLSAVLLALSLVLHIFKLPYPPAPFLKFDGMGVPLAVLALYSLRASLAVLPLAYIGLQLLGADAIGALMKVVAELATFVPLVLAYRRLGEDRARSRVLLVVLAIISRASVMSVLNLLVAPHWLVVTYGLSYEEAYRRTIALLPHIAIFNTIAASYVGTLGLGAFRVISKTFGLDHRARTTPG